MEQKRQDCANTLARPTAPFDMNMNTISSGFVLEFSGGVKSRQCPPICQFWLEFIANEARYESWLNPEGKHC